MSSTQVSNDIATEAFANAAVPLGLEVVVIPVADVDRAMGFYRGLGWRFDGDFPVDENYRVVQLTPPGSNASIVFGKGVTSAQPGSIDGLVLVVADVDAARAELLSHGAEVSEVRFASREHTLLGQFEVGVGVVPGGGPMARLPRLVGRGRALEILLVADDLDGPRAEQYGYVNRVIADDQLGDEVDQIASRLGRFDHDAIARTKSYVDRVTLPADSELPPALADFFELLGRPAQQAQIARREALGLNTDSDLERSLGRRVVESTPDG
ncbi:MAG: enoyl-CoA hydratase-related protein [Thermoleophilaceae bacterium]